VWAFELGHRAGEIAARAGVPKVRFAPGPLPSEAAVPAPDIAPEPSEADVERAAEIASSIGDEALRATVEKAVRLSLARGSADRPI
jgi:hypothetical protein